MFSPTIKGVRNSPMVTMFAPVFHKPQYVPRSYETSKLTKQLML